MATFGYASLRDNTALPLLTRFGQAVTITNRSTGSYDPDTLTNTKTTESVTAIGALVNFEDKPRGFSNVEQNDRKLILDAKNMENAPRIGDEVSTEDGQVLKVKEVMPISPGGVPVIWIARVGK